MLGQPALLLGQGGGDPEGKALLPQQGVAAVATAEGLDLVPLGELYDGKLLRVAGPRDVLVSRLQWIADRVDTSGERGRDYNIMSSYNSRAKTSTLLSQPQPVSGSTRYYSEALENQQDTCNNIAQQQAIGRRDQLQLDCHL